MKTRNKILVGFIAFLLVAGTSANAHKATPKTEKDTTRVSKDDPKIPETSVVDEVIWVIGDEPILKSDVEVMRLQGEGEGFKWNGDPDCAIPEQLAVQKLYLHQAAIDSITVSESQIAQGIDDQINYLISGIGSREKLEEYYKKSLTQIRQDMHDDYKNRMLIQEMKKKIVENITVSPADVRNYFKDLPSYHKKRLTA